MPHSKIVLLLLVVSFSDVVFAGPKVVPHPKVRFVTVRNDKFAVIRELKDPKVIKSVQDIFLRAKKTGDTKTHLKKVTHMIDFSDRWLVDIHSGEITVLSKTRVAVYRIEPKDLVEFKKIIIHKA